MVGVDHAPSTTAFATELGPPISVPVSELIPVPKQPGSAVDRGLETPSAVSDHGVLMIVLANYRSFSTCLWPLAVYYHLRCLMPQCKYLRNQNKISL